MITALLSKEGWLPNNQEKTEHKRRLLSKQVIPKVRQVLYIVFALQNLRVKNKMQKIKKLLK